MDVGQEEGKESIVGKIHRKDVFLWATQVDPALRELVRRLPKSPWVTGFGFVACGVQGLLQETDVGLSEYHCVNFQPLSTPSESIPCCEETCA